jgi:DNA invertase Pin-like site-specific DNA recombinase
MKNAIYARVSTKDHEQNPETQLVQLRDWADRQDVEYQEYVDYASGGNLDRPAWKQLTTDWQRHKIDTIAVVRLDRAFRSVVDMHNCLAEWEARRVRFVSLTQPVDTGTPAGRLLVTMLGAVAEFERDMIRERVRDGLARAKRQGTRLGRPRSRISADRARKYMTGMGVAAAAQALGVSERTLYRIARRD